MPVDYHSYLLSASPPGFDLHCGLRDPFTRHLEREKSPTIITASAVGAVSSFLHPWAGQNGFMPGMIYESPRSRRRDESFRETSSETSLRTQGKSEKSSLRGLTRSKSGKRVSFADDLGEPLVEVRVMTERPDSPPLLHPELLSSLKNDQVSARLTDLLPLKLNFSQPASDYVTFRNKLESSNVALENVILKDYTLVGTIKVKNIAFEKKVAIRYTTNGWKSFRDVNATYVPTSNKGSLPYDTFSFELEVSPKQDTASKLEFAVLYSVHDNEYWDNNSGQNYEVLSSDWPENDGENHNTTDRVVFSLNHSDSWTEFCGWNNMSTTVPYY
ncbi:hypothetical protein LSH36_912g01030 [Paralvinella palmiformis]|uniref:CBM21 domain-containing protein n=1 Tax=Paralvinella palmiformis TaxID=53620 RepID=A0AAD9MSS1_9ANNE|nr:hypothetical protein LSH36_912g01030 [Paralvinella palmiformis]